MEIINMNKFLLLLIFFFFISTRKVNWNRRYRNNHNSHWLRSRNASILYIHSLRRFNQIFSIFFFFNRSSPTELLYDCSFGNTTTETCTLRGTDPHKKLTVVLKSVTSIDELDSLSYEQISFTIHPVLSKDASPSSTTITSYLDPIDNSPCLLLHNKVLSDFILRRWRRLTSIDRLRYQQWYTWSLL